MLLHCLVEPTANGELPEVSWFRGSGEPQLLTCKCDLRPSWRWFCRTAAIYDLIYPLWSCENAFRKALSSQEEAKARAATITKLIFICQPPPSLSRSPNPIRRHHHHNQGRALPRAPGHCPAQRLGAANQEPQQDHRRWPLPVPDERRLAPAAVLPAEHRG